MKVYFARPISNYKTPQDERDITLLLSLGFEVVNPDKEALSERYKTEGMDVFAAAVRECNALAFRAFPDLSIGAGVKKEIDTAIEEGLLIIELPTITQKRCLSVEDTRNYLKYLGQR
jgi:hypothetical protein